MKQRRKFNDVKYFLDIYDQNRLWYFIPQPGFNGYEVSNLGRLRNKKTKVIAKGTIKKNGYVDVSVNNQNYRLHRLVLQTWCPNEDYEELTVDHINGNRSDNRLENLRWATREENTAYMMMHRGELNKEITRLLSKYSYEQVLQMLQQLD